MGPAPSSPAPASSVAPSRCRERSNPDRLSWNLSSMLLFTFRILSAKLRLGCFLIFWHSDRGPCLSAPPDRPQALSHATNLQVARSDRHDFLLAAFGGHPLHHQRQDPWSAAALEPMAFAFHAPISATAGKSALGHTLVVRRSTARDLPWLGARVPSSAVMHSDCAPVAIPKRRVLR